MKRMKKIIVTILSLAMMMGLCVTVNAAESDQNYNEIYYTVYNENGEVVDEGIIPRTTNARYHWSPNITLNNGWYTSFRMPKFQCILYYIKYSNEIFVFVKSKRNNKISIYEI